MTCKEYAAVKKAELKEAIKGSIKGSERAPGLAIIQVGDDPASLSYIKGKLSDCEEIGIRAEYIKLPANASQEEVYIKLREANDDPDTDGIIVQLPLPGHLDAKLIQAAINPLKDVDGLNKTRGTEFIPCTPLGVISYLKAEGYTFPGKTAVVIGRSELVGKPLADLLIKNDATVTLCHSHTPEAAIRNAIEHADMVFTCTNRIESIDYPELNNPEVIIDIGLGKGEDGRLHGNLKKECAERLRGFANKLVISGTGGVGLLTRVTLLENVYTAYCKSGKEAV